MPLTARDSQILKTLSLKVRMLSLEQIASAWWSPARGAEALARRRMGMLAEAGLVSRLYAQVRPLPQKTSPVISWRPGAPPPDFSAAAWKLQARWTAPPRRTSIYIATRTAANQFGGRLRGKVRYDLQATHDLGVAQIYLHILRTDPSSAERWVGEDILRFSRPRQKLPDAAIAREKDKRIITAIEFGGAYDAGRLQDFHQAMAARNMPYQVW